MSRYCGCASAVDAASRHFATGSLSPAFILEALLLICSSIMSAHAEERPGFFDEKEVRQGFFSEDEYPAVPKRSPKLRQGEWKEIIEDPQKFLEKHPDFYVPNTERIKVPTPEGDQPEEESATGTDGSAPPEP